MAPSFVLASVLMQPLLTRVSGCQQTVALTFLTNELFWFNDPFCRKNKKIAEIIANGGDRERKRAAPTHPPYFTTQPYLHSTCEYTCIPLIILLPSVCVSKVHAIHLACVL